MASLAGFGRWARCRDARCATAARYLCWPPLPATSRDTVDAARPNRCAIARSDSSAAKPREISSRSESDNRCDDHSGRWQRPTKPGRHHMGPDRRRWPPQPATDRPQRLTRLEPIPDLELLRLRQPAHHTPPQRDTSLSSKVLQRSPDIAALMRYLETPSRLAHNESRMSRCRRVGWTGLGWATP